LVVGSEAKSRFIVFLVSADLLLNDVISLLSDLVRIPSVCGDEARVADFIAQWLRNNGLAAEMLEVKSGRPNVIVRLKGPVHGPRVMLNGHMDTVAPGVGWEHDPFGAEVQNGMMYGRGTVDMKSGLAAILSAAAQCKAEGLPNKGEIIVAAVVDEEAVDLGSYELVQRGLTDGLDFAMISEATDLNVVTAHRGRAVFEVSFHGKAAHSMWPNHGVNAIENAAVLINSLSKLGGPAHPTMGRSTVNVLKVEGGQEEVMLVPDRCRVVIDRCLVPGYSTKDALNELRGLIKETGVNADATLVDRETPFCDPFEITEDQEVVKTVIGVAAKVLGRTPGIGFHEGPCDSCILVNQGSVPTLEFGPSGGRLHQSDEFVDLESVKKTTEFYRELIRTLFA
jgi:acetylornithine deacetylase/succinyl-diaminopimelate desuccinylase family protein